MKRERNRRRDNGIYEKGKEWIMREQEEGK
jgi:hypothetical protein